MTFLAPSRLWLLLVVAGLVVAYVVLQKSPAPLRGALHEPRSARIGRAEAVRAGGATSPRPRSASSLVALIVGIARPARDEKVPSDEAIVMLVVDVSASMEATDVAPSRLQAAQEAAAPFRQGRARQVPGRPHRLRRVDARARDTDHATTPR